MDFFKLAKIDNLPEEVKILVWTDLLRLAARIQVESNKVGDNDTENANTFVAILHLVQEEAITFFLSQEMKEISSEIDSPESDKAQVFKNIIDHANYISKIEEAIKTSNLTEKVNIYNSISK